MPDSERQKAIQIEEEALQKGKQSNLTQQNTPVNIIPKTPSSLQQRRRTQVREKAKEAMSQTQH